MQWSFRGLRAWRRQPKLARRRDDDGDVKRRMPTSPATHQRVRARYQSRSSSAFDNIGGQVRDGLTCRLRPRDQRIERRKARAAQVLHRHADRLMHDHPTPGRCTNARRVAHDGCFTPKTPRVGASLSSWRSGRGTIVACTTAGRTGGLPTLVLALVLPSKPPRSQRRVDQRLARWGGRALGQPVGDALSIASTRPIRTRAHSARVRRSSS